jgi:diadenosine tetraphosphate (Ap4A) HIT family hydrolase
MQNGSGFSVAPFDPTCPFCQRAEIAHILRETPRFLLAADHAPLVEGHLLIIPKAHYTCYGDVPAALDVELFELKEQVRRFFTGYYHPPAFWEHGIFRQTVFHAHLHCFPWGDITYDLNNGLHDEVITSQEDVRRWHAEYGPYFYLEDPHIALIFQPELERYTRIIRSVFLQGMTRSGVKPELHSPEQRMQDGIPLIAALIEKWNQFEQQGANYANEPGSR